MIPWPRPPLLGRSAAAEVRKEKEPARLASAHQPTRPPPRTGAAAPPRGRSSRPLYEVVTFFFLLAFFIGLLSLALPVPLAKQSDIALDCQA